MEIVLPEKGFYIHHFVYDARSARNALANFTSRVSWKPTCLIVEIKKNIFFLGCFPRETIFILNIFYNPPFGGNRMGWTGRPTFDYNKYSEQCTKISIQIWETISYDMDGYLNLTFLRSWTDARVIVMTFRTHFLTLVTIKIHVGCVPIFVTILMSLFCGGIMENEIDPDSNPSMLWQN